MDRYGLLNPLDKETSIGKLSAGLRERLAPVADVPLSVVPVFLYGFHREVAPAESQPVRSWMVGRDNEPAAWSQHAMQLAQGRHAVVKVMDDERKYGRVKALTRQPVERRGRS